MAPKDDGGFAFPTDDVQAWATCPRCNLSHRRCGMTLRDYFAGQALAGMSIEVGMEDIAARCYCLADAMLAERSK
jgi:hypothetical protein